MAHYLRPATVRMIEQELLDYRETLRTIEELEQSIAMPGASRDENADIRAQGGHSDPTMRGVAVMADHRLLQEMRRKAGAITTALDEADLERRRWAEYRYFHRPRLSAEEAADRSGVSLRGSTKWKQELLSRIADLLGEW